ncbi:MAG: class I tRNA ligase family protein, partial [Candidatus Bathyarchaeia archaeon]
WEPDWIIEALSDSTIYMAYYTVCRKLKELKPSPESLGLAFWDYVFLGEGDIQSVASSTGISVEDLEELREEFKYFYPLDCRHSGRDLIPNHLTFMIFNHVGIFPSSLWPRGIAVNGSVLMEGQKMSKSLNNIIPLISAIERYGADPLRLSLMITAEPIKDADFSEDIAKTMRENLEKYYSKAIEILKTTSDYVGEFSEIDRWMLSRLQWHIKEATEAMAELKVRKAIHAIFYNLNQDLDWYMRRVEPQKKDESRRRVIDGLLRRVLNVQVRMLAPFTPHICEELWEAMGGEGSVSFAEWPKVDDKLIRLDVEEMESTVKLVLADVENIVKATGMKPSQIIFYVATGWKWKVYLKALTLASKCSLDVGSLIKECFKDEELKMRVKEIPAFARDVAEDVKKMPEETLKLRLSIGAV